MIWTAMMAVSLFAFTRQFWLLRQYQQYPCRRGLTGCEMARQLLDKAGFPQIPVQIASAWECFRQGVDKQLFLEESIHRGHRLYDVARTAERTMALSKSSAAVIPVNWMFRLRLILKILIIPAWLFYLAGLLNPQRDSFQLTGQLILQVTIILGVFEFSRDWENSQEALEFLKKTEIFEQDELIKLRALLSALKWRGLAEIFKVPFDAVCGLIRKRDGYGV